MTDNEKTPALAEGDTPVTRPDLDRIRKTAEGGWFATAAETLAVLDALGAERARADHAEQRIVDAPHDTQCASGIRMYFHKPWACDCWKSAAPTINEGI